MEAQIPAPPSAGELKAQRLARIRERARAKPPVEADPEPQPPVETPTEPEVPPVVVAVAETPVEIVVVAEAQPVVMAEAPPVIEPEAPPVVLAEPPPPAVVVIAPVERTMTPSLHHQPWAPPRPRRPRTAAGLIVRAVSTLIRWGWGLRR